MRYVDCKYEIDLHDQTKEIIRGHLDLSGSNPKGDTISVNSYYIERNHKPFYPVAGEFHYSRYPQGYWDESIRKIKAGGLNMIATYVFWNMHERREGVFDWSGNLDLRKFIELCHKSDLFAIVRIGPFCHGEIRNGGLPDWLYGRPFDVRSNDPDYLFYVERLYSEIAKQLTGTLYKDGGPVIGVQLENEYQHSAATWWLTYPHAKSEYTVANRDRKITQAGVGSRQAPNEYDDYGQDHMQNLKRIAQRAGIDVPIFTATGWGNASIVQKGCIPVTGAYVYPTWTKLVPSQFYLYKDIHHHPDYLPVSYEPELYPSLSAELGSGIMISNSRRPTVPFESIEPLVVRAIGSGSNGIGYYMYHGGSTPVFDNIFYSEETFGLPKICYDFQAPIGEYGQIRPSYRYLRLIHLFLQSYGEVLAPMKTILPPTNSQITFDDTTTLRYVVRAKGNAGFVFMHNFQDHVELNDLEDLKIKLSMDDDEIQFPQSGSFTLKKGVCAILPFNLQLDDLIIRQATLQPLTILKVNGQKHYVFFSIEGLRPEIVISSEKKRPVTTSQCIARHSNGLVTIEGATNAVFSFTVAEKHFLVVPRSLALECNVYNQKQLIFSQALLLDEGTHFVVLNKGSETAELLFYPRLETEPDVSEARLEKRASDMDEFGTYRMIFEKARPKMSINRATPRHLQLTADSDLMGLNDMFVKIEYVGDRGQAFINGKLVADHFYYGQAWEIGLKKFLPQLRNNPMVFYFHPMYSDAEYLVDFEKDKLPDFSVNPTYLKVGNIELIPEYKALLKLGN
jgi:hypothetical protein